MNTYGSRLQAALERKNASRADLARAIGRTPQAVGQVINGTTKAMTAENNSLAAIYLDVNPNWLATGEGEMAPAGQTEPTQVSSPPDELFRMDALLTELQAIVEGLAPVLQEPGRAALLKWTQGQASATATAVTLRAYQQASKALPTAPAALIETPVRHRPPVDHD